MKKCILTSFMALAVLFSFSQGKRTETKIITENGITKKWTITKEYDQNGQLIDFDSTYVETDNPSELNQQGFHFNYSPNQFGDIQEFRQFNMDSTMQQFQIDMSDMMQNMEQMMHSFNIDSLLNNMMNQMQNFDSGQPLAPQEEEIIIPESQKGRKGNNKRI